MRSSTTASGTASAFGLAAADGVVAGLRADNMGFEARGYRVPIVPGAILFGMLAYVVAWLLIPEAATGTKSSGQAAADGSWRSRRLRRSTDSKIAGVCGGIAEYFSVDATAGRIWDMIEQPVALNDVVATLVREYDVSPDDCEAQVKSFVGDLISNGLALEQ